jgi:hypothetical protein
LHHGYSGRISRDLVWPRSSHTRETARGVAAAGIVLAGMSLIGLLGYALYGRAMSFAEELPVYALKVQQPGTFAEKFIIGWLVSILKSAPSAYVVDQYCLEGLRPSNNVAQ